MSRSNVPAITERDFMDQVTELAEIRGWSWAHFRPAMTTKGWRTPVSGPLGKGWPDLVLVRPSDHRILFVECKRSIRHTLSPEQDYVMGVLSDVMTTALQKPDVDVRTWSPEAWDAIEETLR